jgi:hypothetical protein
LTTASPPSAPLSSGAPSLAPAIDPFQRRIVRVLMGAIMFLTGTYVGVDWAGFYHGFSSTYPAGAGYARTLLCAVLVALIGQAAVDRRDQTLLGGAFAIILLADYFLILRDDSAITGTLLFAVVHGLLIYRHARGLLASLEPAERGRTIHLLLLTALVIYGGSTVLVVEVRPILMRTNMFALDAAYVFVLATSLWSAWGTLIRRFYARRNAWFIAIGMTCFYFCDVTVGLSLALLSKPDTHRWGQVLNNLIAFFYSPALVLLAYSGFRWEYRRETPVA